jgi:hypothetical protein
VAPPVTNTAVDSFAGKLAVVTGGGSGTSPATTSQPPTTARLPLDPRPPADLVLVGDDDNVIGDGRLAVKRLGHADEVRRRAAVIPV